MDVRSAAGLGRGSHRSSHTPAPPHKEAQARREIPPSPPQVGLSRTASAGGSTVGEEVQGFPAPIWILLQNEVLRRHGVRVPGLQHPRETTQQTTNCGGIVLTFDIHMSTPFGATSCAAQGQGHNGR